MQSGDLSHEELISFASLLYGEKWRDELAKNLNISRKQLVLTLAAGDPIPQEISVPMVALLENHLIDRKAEIEMIEARLAQLHGTKRQDTQSKVERKSAS